VRAVRPREIQARARERDVQRVPGQHQHDGGGARGVGGVRVRAGLLFGGVCVRAVRCRLLQRKYQQRGVRAVPRRHVLPGAVGGARALRGEQLAAGGGRGDAV